MRVDDVLAELKPEHFTNSKVPSRTTVSDRLAGVGLKIDFVEAIADICSDDAAGRERLLGQVRSMQKRAATSDPLKQKSASQGHREQTDDAAVTAELVMVQKRSLEVSDKLMRALERAQELEKERNSANHMVLLLLTMVDRLQRDITTLARERDRLRTAAAPHQTTLNHVRTRLAKSEEQRTTAESELDRARAERHKADRLAEEAAEQVRVLTLELDRLRAQVPDLNAETSPPSAPLSTLQEALDTDASDIDQALAKATRHLDDRAGRLDRLADELQLDNPPDNFRASKEEPDNSSAGSLPRRHPMKPKPDNSKLSPFDVLNIVQVLRMDNGRTLNDAPETLTAAALSQPCGKMLESVSLLRTAGYDADADHLLAYAGERRPPEDVPELIDALRADERSTDAYRLLTAIGQKRPPAEVVEVVSHLRRAQHDADAYQILAAVGRVRSAYGVIAILDAVTEQDESWVLGAARRDRHLKDIPSLIHALEVKNRLNAARMMSTSYAERAGDLGVPQTADSGDLWLRPDLADDDEAEEVFNFRTYQTPTNQYISQSRREAEAAPTVHPYAAREVRRDFMPVDTMVISLAGGVALNRLLPEQRRIGSLCKQAVTVKEISQELGIPLGVTRILVADLLESGILGRAQTGYETAIDIQTDPVAE
ncbi:DUF742 domain-containing protein [Streptomyces sp. NPDC059496]|uniref:DUF742 domain-containing protein n=1 Tax=Streptomyces sp. NPDC059496 TaxID=3346851 RepID=UPI0036AC3B00